MWRPLTPKDLLARLSAKEIEAYRKSFETDEASASVLEQLCASTADFVRGRLRAGGKVRLSSKDSTIPEGLISAACDWMMFDLLTRVGLVVNESRTLKRTQAEELFKDVADGKFIPESYGTESAARTPAYHRKPFRLDY